MKTVGIIPARLESTRLPAKLLLDWTGKPLIQYVWETAVRCGRLSEVIVAADSPRIAEVVARFGGRCELTGEHASGTDRIAEVARRCCPDAEVLVNIQGDEPELDSVQIDGLVALLDDNAGSQMATLATPFTSMQDLHDPSCVKVVCASDGRALYFSRSLIPHWRSVEAERVFRSDASEAGQHLPEAMSAPWLLHLGLYAYRREFLLRLTDLPPSPLEQIEKLEQLRALEAGATIQVGVVDHHAAGIDTPDDYERFVQRQLARAA